MKYSNINKINRRFNFDKELFNDIKNFNKNFKQIFRVTPKNFN